MQVIITYVDIAILLLFKVLISAEQSSSNVLLVNVVLIAVSWDLMNNYMKLSGQLQFSAKYHVITCFDLI